MTKKIRFMETVLRDGHQSLVATRMSTPEMLPILKKWTKPVMMRLKSGAARPSMLVCAT